MTYQVYVFSLKNKTHVIDINQKMNYLDIKKIISQRENIPISYQKCVHNQRELRDEELVTLKKESIIYIQLNFNYNLL